jgi:hypothetical protein
VAEKNEIQPSETEIGAGELQRRTAGNIRQDFYAMMRVSNLPAGVLRKANRKTEERGKS